MYNCKDNAGLSVTFEQALNHVVMTMVIETSNSLKSQNITLES